MSASPAASPDAPRWGRAFQDDGRNGAGAVDSREVLTPTVRARTAPWSIQLHGAATSRVISSTGLRKRPDKLDLDYRTWSMW